LDGFKAGYRKLSPAICSFKLGGKQGNHESTRMDTNFTEDILCPVLSFG